MPKCVIDGREAEFTPGENLVDIAKRVGVEIPVFCYHPGLTVVAQCRMCMVEVEKMPKLQTACSTKASEGMVVKTQSEAVKTARSSVMEFLLLNHPLDCPICDKSGECDLQDNSFNHGSAYMRTTEERRTYVDLDMGPVIQKNMNRCIHCTRCIRFGDEIAGIREMVALQRGNKTEITTVDGRSLETDYAGNYADVCPTGSLTLKDFRFTKRAWFLKKTPTVCEGCSKGCNMEIQWENSKIYRCIPRPNPEINKYWLCDEGRFNYHYVNDPSRVIEPMSRQGGSLAKSDWNAALAHARSMLSGRKTAVLLGSDATLEEAKKVQEFAAKHLGGAKVLHFGTPGVTKSSQDAPADRLLKRKSKTSNLNGMEKLGIAPLEGALPEADVYFIVRGGRAQLSELLAGLSGKKAIGFGVFTADEAAAFETVLPGLSFAEKDGTIVNHEGREQRIRRSIPPVGRSKSLGEVLLVWSQQRDEVTA